MEKEREIRAVESNHHHGSIVGAAVLELNR
jgi:hypothetical protein